MISRRELNRATLARQSLLARRTLAPLQAVEGLLAVQAQLPRAPFVGLWARTSDFAPSALLDEIRERRLVRATMMRATLHLMTATDLLAFRTTLRTDTQLALPGRAWSLDELQPSLEVAQAYFAQPAPFEGLRERLEAAGFDEVRLRAYAARLLLPLVQAPSESAPYGFDTGGHFVLADAELGANPAETPAPRELVRRYLAAWGPSTPADFAAWSGMKGVAAWFTSQADELAVLTDERKRTLYDLPDAPRPNPDTPAPVRLLPEFDGVMLGWQDRTRVIAAEDAPRIANRNLQVPAVVLVDGFVAGVWKVERKRKVASLTVRPFRVLQTAERRDIEAEALALLATFEPEAAPAVAFEAP